MRILINPIARISLGITFLAYSSPLVIAVHVARRSPSSSTAKSSTSAEVALLWCDALHRPAASNASAAGVSFGMVSSSNDTRPVQTRGEKSTAATLIILSTILRRFQLWWVVCVEASGCLASWRTWDLRRHAWGHGVAVIGMRPGAVSPTM